MEKKEGEKKKKNKVEEIQLANLARPSQAKIACSHITYLVLMK